MSRPEDYGPSSQGESPAQVMLERTFLASGYLTGAAFGVQFMLYLACCRVLWRRPERTRVTWFMLVYITVLCSLGFIYAVTSMITLPLVFIDNREYPGGPFAYIEGPFTINPDSIVSLASYILGNLMSDCLLLWRCQVIWRASIGRKAYLVVLVPFLMWLASFALGMGFEVCTAIPGGLYGKPSDAFAVPFFIMSLALNIILTLLIVARLWFHRYQNQRHFGVSHGRQYVSVASMFVESAAPYCVTSILLLGTFIADHPVNQIWLAVAPFVQMISSYLIIYRLAKGRAWAAASIRTASNDLTAIVFCDASIDGAATTSSICEGMSRKNGDLGVNEVTATAQCESTTSIASSSNIV